MTEYRTIDIDLDVHKTIELEKRSFSEPDNLVLRRLLGIDDAPEKVVSTGRAWSGKRVTLPHGTELQMEYNGRVHQGRIEDGRWMVEGKSFNSPSAAAGGVAMTKSGTRTNLDGWIYWQVKRPDDSEWLPLKFLRKMAELSD